MAKRYTKPTIAFQNLSMGTDVSAGCSMDITFAEFFCPVMIPEWGETVFTEVSDCTWYNDEIYICYHVPTMDSNVFGS